MEKTIIIGCDHAGVDAKLKVIEILEKLEFKIIDLGTDSPENPVDYPDIAKKVCKKVLENLDKNMGILICGSGEGMSLQANRFKKIRADLCYDEYSAKMARYDNDANILCLRAREFDHKLYKKIVPTFFLTNFSGFERHKRRIEMLDEEI